MEKFEWERLRDGYREQRDRAASEGRYANAAEYDRLFRWACDEITAINAARFEEMREIAEITEATTNMMNGELRIRCQFGTIVASTLNGELYIDLEKPDGGMRAIAIVGTRSEGTEHGIHVDVWDGNSEDFTWHHEIDPDGAERY